jgi:hypothetical protein
MDNLDQVGVNLEPDRVKHARVARSTTNNAVFALHFDVCEDTLLPWQYLPTHSVVAR